MAELLLQRNGETDERDIPSCGFDVADQPAPVLGVGRQAIGRIDVNQRDRGVDASQRQEISPRGTDDRDFDVAEAAIEDVPGDVGAGIDRELMPTSWARMPRTRLSQTLRSASRYALPARCSFDGIMVTT